jgi:acetylglutamate/LysW-gamma-L-alpha-aminoadipate kinase
MIVVKVGGAQGIDMENVVRDLVAYRDNMVLVHGCSHELDMLQKNLGIQPRMVTSVSGYQSRYTDRQTLELFMMVCSGKINKMIVEQCQQYGLNAIGISGVDGRLLEGKKKDILKILEDGKKKILRGDFTGIVEKVNVNLLSLLLNNGYLPVVAPLAVSYDQYAINVDGDRAAAAIAGALHAEVLIILSNVPGLLDLKTNNLIEKISKEECMQYARGRMMKKILGAKEALAAGVDKVILSSANISHPISSALQGAGTVIL